MLERAQTHARRLRPEDRPRARPGPWLALFAAALLVRVLYVWIAAGPAATPSSDALEYDTVAWNLARGAGFALDGAGGHYPTAFVPPVVPWLVSLTYRAFGHHYFFALLLQCVLGAVVPLVLASFGGAVFGGGIGLLAGWLAALDPLLVFFSGYLLTETTFTALLLVALAVSAAWVKTPRSGRALGVGLAWGVASLARPTALLLPLVVAFWGWVPLGLTVPTRERARQIALLLLGLALAIGPWTIRNALTLHAFVPVTTGGGRALLDSNNPIVWSDPLIRGGAISTTHVEPYARDAAGRSEAAADAIARSSALEFLSGHVREWPAMALAKLRRFWRVTAEGGGTGTWQRQGSPLGGLARRIDPLAAWSLLVLPFALWGVARTLSGPRRWFQSLSLLVVIYFTLLSLVFWGALRMRVPVEPLIALFAAVGFEDARRRVRTRARGLRVIEGRR
jgi:4-amino-4-deoxy-L-arabinose transferase-like glycosyltransferase